MNEHTQAMRARLEEMLKDISSELSSIGIHNPENPSDWIAVPDELDAEEPDQNLAADAVEEWDGRQGIVSVLESRYNSIKNALKRIDAGTFGVCAVCGTPIEERRLEASPVARTCIAHIEEESSLA